MSDSPSTRFPTLQEVLSRRTVPPVDLYSFYIYMRDQQQAVNYLDFWLDVEQHLLLCRHYVKDLRRSVMVETPEMEDNMSRNPPLDQQAVSEYLRDNRNDDTRSDDGVPDHQPQSHNRDSVSSTSRLTENSHERAQLTSDGTPRMAGAVPSSPALSLAGSMPRSDQLAEGGSDHDGSLFAAPIPDNELNRPESDDKLHPKRSDLLSSAQKILYTYLQKSAVREIILPFAMVSDIEYAISDKNRDDPELFDDAKDYVFDAMERDAFPGFLQARGLGNLIRPTLMLYAIAGFFSIFASFWTAFVLIFLGYSRAERCWLILPFTLAIYLLVSYQYRTDPILALVGLSQYTFTGFHRIVNSYVRSMLIRRALVVLVLSAIITAAACLLFILVPSKRL